MDRPLPEPNPPDPDQLSSPGTPTELPPTRKADGYGTHPGWNVGDQIDGRYRLEKHLGAGGFGTVFAATDTTTDRAVAIKGFLRDQGFLPARFRREVRALATMRIPGVVPFLAEGVADNAHYIIMEIARGVPFPGECESLDWSDLQPTVVALLETIARVHSTGIVHRDLKPANVLVDEEGVPTLLDFGLAWGPDLGSRQTGVGNWLGTPHYVAPEQIGGRPVDPRADFYSLGVMIYEALTGVLPYRGETFGEIQMAKSQGRPVPLRHHVPSLPAIVSDLVGSLLHPDAHERPSTAEEILRTLTGGTRARPFEIVPWLGSDAPLSRIAEAIEHRSALGIAGGPGIGKSRCLEEAEHLAHAAGRSIVRILPASTPFASLTPLIGSTPPRDLSLDDAKSRVEEELRRALRSGDQCILVDDIERADRWSREILQSLSAESTMIVTRQEPAPGDFELEPLTVEALRRLFRGPDRILHLRQDAAAQLFFRTSGIPEQVFEELAAWERAGLCRRKNSEWVVSRESLDQLMAGFERTAGLRVGMARRSLPEDQQALLAWIELAFPHATGALLSEVSEQPLWEIEGLLQELSAAGAVRRTETGNWAPIVTGQSARVWNPEERRRAHQRIAAALPEGARSRLHHLVSAQSSSDRSTNEVAAECLREVERRIEQGRFGLAVSAAELSSGVLRELGDVEGEIALLEVWGAAAGSLGLASFLPVLRTCEALAELDSRAQPLFRIFRAVDFALRERGEEAIARLRAIPGPLSPRLETWRLGAMAGASQILSPEREEEVIEEIESKLTPDTQELMRNRIQGYRGHLFYRRSEFRQAAEAHEGALRGQPTAGPMINACLAWVECGNFTRAEEINHRCLELASQTRQPVHELWGYYIASLLAYRARRWDPLDDDLLEIARPIVPRSMWGMLQLLTAAHRWRLGERPVARDRAEAASVVFTEAQQSESAALSRLFADFLGSSRPSERGRTDLDQLVASSRPGLRLQADALFRAHGNESNVTAADRTAWAKELKDYPLEAPREIFSIEECLAPAPPNP